MVDDGLLPLTNMLHSPYDTSALLANPRLSDCRRTPTEGTIHGADATGDVIWASSLIAHGYRQIAFLQRLVALLAALDTPSIQSSTAT